VGAVEDFKNEFQKILSSSCLPIQNKQNIGVNISKIDHFYRSNQKFEYLLWNIDCGRHRSSLRTIFYSGAEAIIIILSETSINQIRQYFNELQTRIPGITLIFCIIIDKLTKREIIKNNFNTEELSSLFTENNFQIHEITKPSKILDQLSEIVEKKGESEEYKTNLIIDLISINSLFGSKGIQDECHDYFEPEVSRLRIKQRANTDLLRRYIKNLDLDLEYHSFNLIKVDNKDFGTFAININNGNVSYYPKICERCRNRKCSLFETSHSICIEADERNGWTNIKGLTQIELLIMTKILALKEGNDKNLPKSILNQIKKLNKCKKKNKRK
jgi:hypothetical protein